MASISGLADQKESIDQEISLNGRSSRFFPSPWKCIKTEGGSKLPHFKGFASDKRYAASGGLYPSW